MKKVSQVQNKTMITMQLSLVRKRWNEHCVTVQIIPGSPGANLFHSDRGCADVDVPVDSEA